MLQCSSMKTYVHGNGATIIKIKYKFDKWSSSYITKVCAILDYLIKEVLFNTMFPSQFNVHYVSSKRQLREIPFY